MPYDKKPQAICIGVVIRLALNLNKNLVKSTGQRPTGRAQLHSGLAAKERHRIHWKTLLSILFGDSFFDVLVKKCCVGV
jgi:hypothetical protein